MPRKKSHPSASAVSATSPEVSCGCLTPRPDDSLIPSNANSDSLLTKMKLTCDGQTGVLFYRHRGKFYLRTVMTDPVPLPAVSEVAID